MTKTTLAVIITAGQHLIARECLLLQAISMVNAIVTVIKYTTEADISKEDAQTFIDTLELALRGLCESSDTGLPPYVG